MAEREDMAFLVVRERQSRELSAVPGDIAVQRAHLGMADGYAARIFVLKFQTFSADASAPSPALNL